MASKSETTFGAKLQRGYELYHFINNYPNYKSPRPEDSPAALLTFLDELQALNKQKSQADQEYALVTDEREKMFRTGSAPIRKLVTQIGNAVKGQYGKDSKEYQSVSQIVGLISRSNRSAKNGNGQADGQAPDAVSRSFQSYGSLAGNFEKLVAALKALPGYNPANDSLKTEPLDTLAARLRNLNAAVVPKYEVMKRLGDDRSTRYEILKDMAVRIKSNVQAIYGTGSVEYRNVKGLKF